MDILLLHGALGARTQLGPLAARLSASRRVLTLDFEGHGGAPPRGRPFSMATFVSNVLELLDEEGIGAANIFGYSMGGYVALLLASSHPDRVGRIATLGTKFRWDPATAEREVSRLDPEKLRAKVPQFADALAVRHAAAGGWERVLTDTARLLRSLGANPLLDDGVLGEITHPVTAMVGERDATVTVEETEEVSRAIRKGRCLVLPDTPHPLEQVDIDLLATRLEAALLTG